MTIGQFDFEVTKMKAGDGLPFDPYVLLCLKRCGAETRDRFPVISARLMSSAEIDEHINSLKADLDAVAARAKRALQDAVLRTRTIVADRPTAN